MVEVSDDMEVEQPQLSTSCSDLAKRFGLRNTIQTSFGDDYIFQIVAKNDFTSMAVSLSTNAVKLYSPVTGQYLGECAGHSSTINQISFGGAASPHLLYSCSWDSTIRAWDTRCFQEVSCFSAGSSQEVFSFSCGGAGDNLLAAGCKSQVLFWDWRNKKQVACLEESHMEDVTQVHFIPGYQNKLLSASVDGLICLFDTSGDINDDDHLDSVLNVGTSIARVGFLGANNRKLWCLTHIETLSIWDWKESAMEANFENARNLASESWSLDNVDYFVDCHYSIEEDCLWVIGGTNAGNLGYFPLSFKSATRQGPAIGSAEAVFVGGHTGVVRSVLPMPCRSGRITQCQGGIFGWTGGEDGRLCCWLSDESTVAQRSWISSALVAKSPRIGKKSRHSPY